MKQSILTDDEIEVYRDFGSIVKQARPRGYRWVYYAGSAVGVAVLVVAVWWKSDSVPPLNTRITEPPALPERVDSDKPNVIATDSVQVAVPEEKRSQRVTASRPEVVTPATEKPKVGGYTQAEPAGGYEKLYSYFSQELRYPDSAIRDSVQGVVVIDFVINVAGKPEQIQVQQSLSEACDAEAKRVIENMLPWVPASLNGKPVPARLSVPLTFQLLKPGQK